MRFLIVFILALFVSGCNDQQILTSYKYMVVHPDEAMYRCPVLKEFPNWRTLTDSQVARTVVQLQKNNLTCKSSIESIRKFLDESDKRIKKGA